MRFIEKIVIHCTFTPPTMNIGVEEVRKWHVEENKWSDIGYHFVIRRDGTVESGRPVERPGAHVKGHNSNSIGIAWVGRNFGEQSGRHPCRRKSGHQLANERKVPAAMVGHNKRRANAKPDAMVANLGNAARAVGDRHRKAPVLRCQNGVVVYGCHAVTSSRHVFGWMIFSAP